MLVNFLRIWKTVRIELGEIDEEPNNGMRRDPIRRPTKRSYMDMAEGSISPVARQSC